MGDSSETVAGVEYLARQLRQKEVDLLDWVEEGLVLTVSQPFELQN